MTVVCDYDIDEDAIHVESRMDGGSEFAVRGGQEMMGRVEDRKLGEKRGSPGVAGRL